MKKAIKTLFLVVFGLFAALALAVLIAPTFFKDKLVQTVKAEINQQIEGEIDFSEIDVTWWNTFPDVSLSLEQLRVSGNKKDSTKLDLLTAKELAFTFDFKSVWTQGDSLELKSFFARNPEVFIYIDETGHANYDLVPDNNNSSAESAGIKFDLSNYEIKEATIHYVDQITKTDISLKDVDHKGSLTYEQDALIWDARLTSPTVNYAQNSIPYIENSTLDYNGKMNLDLKNKMYTFLNNNLILNALELFFEGGISQSSDDINFDVRLNTRKNTFKSFLSILPNIYSKEFNDIDARGSLVLNGSLNGLYNSNKNLFPKYTFNLIVEDGWFQFPDKSQAISDIFLTSNITNGNKADPNRIDVPTFKFTINEEEVSGKVLIRNQDSNQFFDGKIKGKVNLSDLHAAYPSPSVKAMSGLLDIDATFKGNTNAIVANDLSQLVYAGFINGENIRLDVKDQPAVSLNRFSSTLKNDKLVISQVDGTAGQSDFEGNGAIAPLSVFITDSKAPLEVQANLRGENFNVNEFLVPEKEGSFNESPDVSSSSDLLQTLQMNIQAEYKNVIYEDYDLKNIQASAKGSLQNLSVSKFTGNVNQSPLNASGAFKNIYGYMYKKEELMGDLNVKTNNFDLDFWMTEEETASNNTAETSYVAIPERINLTIQVDAEKINYEDIDVKNAKGKLIVQNQRISFDDMTGNTLGGQFDIDGYYAHDGKGEPLFKLDYDLRNFSFKQTFQQVETAEFLLPIIKYISGTFNTNMTLEGVLKPGYMPDLSSIDGQGLLETLHGNIANNKTLNKVSELVNLDDLKRITVDYTRNRFDIKDGTLSIDPFDKEIDGVFATISGQHNLGGDMSYKMALTIPTEKFKASGFPVDIKNQFERVQKELNKFGIPLKDTESIRVNVLLEGEIMNPKVRVQLVDFSKQSVKDAVKNTAKDLIEQAKDSVKNETTREVIKVVQGEKKDSTQTSAKEAVKVRVKEEADKKIKEEVKPVTDTIAAKAEEAIKDKLGDELGDKIDDDVKDKGKEILDNIFKKNKKDKN